MTSIHDGIESLTALMNIISNPQAAKERFDQLTAHIQAIKDLSEEAAKQSYADIAAATDARNAAASERQTAEATLEAHRLEVARFHKERTDHAQQMEQQRQKLANEREVFDRTRKELTLFTATLADRDAALARAEAAISGHEQVAAENAQATAKARVDAEVLKAQYEERIAALHKAMGSL